MVRSQKDTRNWFGERLLSWAQTLDRPMPWRGERDPYRIWLSEVILQQTRVAQGKGYYLRFLTAFPNVEALAAASEDAVLALWQGLGYYSRARNMHAAALRVRSEFDGIFPSAYAKLITLPGIGPYSAAAIASFSSGEPVAVVDGNVYRVLARVFGMDVPIDKPIGQRTFRMLAQELMAKAQAAAYNQAIMDFGATLCTPRSPRCVICPLQDRCLAFARGQVEQLPVKVKKVKRLTRYLDYLHLVRSDGAILLRRRGPGDIWQGLYDLPYVENDSLRSHFASSNAADFSDDSPVLCQESQQSNFSRTASILDCIFPSLVGSADLEAVSRPRRYLLSHQDLIIRYWRYRWTGVDHDLNHILGSDQENLVHESIGQAPPTSMRWVTPQDLTSIGMPQPLLRYLTDPALTLLLP